MSEGKSFNRRIKNRRGIDPAAHKGGEPTGKGSRLMLSVTHDFLDVNTHLTRTSLVV